MSVMYLVLIVNELVVDGEVKIGDKVVVEDLEFEFGMILFNILEVVFDVVIDGVYIYLENIEFLIFIILDKFVILEGIND